MKNTTKKIREEKCELTPIVENTSNANASQD